MRHPLRWLPALFFTLSLFARSTPASATTALVLGDVQQADRSTAVVVGEIGEQLVDLHPKWNKPRTLTTVHVEEVLAGRAPQTLVIEQLGGEYEDVTLHVPGDAALEPGQRCVLFLNQENGGWYLTAMEQSMLRIVPSLQGDLLERAYSSSYVEVGADGLLAPVRPDANEITLYDLRTLLKSPSTPDIDLDDSEVLR